MSSPLPVTYQREYARRRWGKDTVRQIAADLGVPDGRVASWGRRGGWGKLPRGRPRRIDWDDVRRRLDAGEPWQEVVARWRTTGVSVRREFLRRGWPQPRGLPWKASRKVRA